MILVQLLTGLEEGSPGFTTDRGREPPPPVLILPGKALDLAPQSEDLGNVGAGVRKEFTPFPSTTLPALGEYQSQSLAMANQRPRGRRRPQSAGQSLAAALARDRKLLRGALLKIYF